MKKTWLALPAILGMAMWQGGCKGKTYPMCDDDDGCKEHNEKCVQGQCQECGANADCKSGFVCKSTKCVPKPECEADSDCPTGKKCHNESCVACAADSDCPSGNKCQAAACVPAAECVSDGDCGEGKECSGGKCQQSAKAACRFETVHFGFNEANLGSEATRVLQSDADCLKSKKAAVTIAGHADERGTEEYNLHLGEKRANAVKKYLTQLGVDGKSLKTVSYGEDRPASSGHDEAAWAENRRAELQER